MLRLTLVATAIFIASGFAVGNAAVMDTINGKVLAAADDSPLDSVTIRSEGAVTLTDANGAYKLIVPDSGLVGVIAYKNRRDPVRWDLSGSGNPENSTVEIRNLAGRIVAFHQNGKSSDRLSLAHLPQGAYVATVRTSSSAAVFKIVKVQAGSNNAPVIAADPSRPVFLAKTGSTVKAHTVAIRKPGFNVAAISVPAKTSTSDVVTTKLFKSEFDAKFDPSTVPGIKPLFDGQTLDGWDHPGTWAFAEGTIKGGPGFWGFCSTNGTYDKFRLFVSIIQDGHENDGGHSGIGVDGSGNGGFHDLMTPSCNFWDYDYNFAGKTTRCVDLALPDTKPKTSPDQVYWHTEWFQLEILVDLTKGTYRAAMNGIDFLEHSFSAKDGGKPGTIGLQSHNGGSVRYKDIWIEVNPKAPDSLLSARK